MMIITIILIMRMPAVQDDAVRKYHFGYGRAMRMQLS